MSGDISPDVLDDDSGQWVRRGATWRWQPAVEKGLPRPARSEQALDVSELLACPTCRVRIWEHCKTKSGRHRLPHATRIISRRCMCGEVLGEGRKLCEPCRAEARRINARIGMRAFRERQRASREVA